MSYLNLHAKFLDANAQVEQAKRTTQARSPHLNDGTSTPDSKRSHLGLHGLSPATVESLHKLERRAYAQFQSKTSPIEKYMFLAWLRNTHIRLFYCLLLHHLKEITPIIYTPTVGEACQKYSDLYPFLGPPASADGMFLSFDDLQSVERLDTVITNYHNAMTADPQICVITDGSRILGLGDLGINGMGIPVGKLQLYVAAAGFDPKAVLPICVDFGTNNKKLIDDEFYLGRKHPRPNDEEFHRMMDLVVDGLHRHFPKMLIQFEDFSSEHAFELLDRHKGRVLSFNDDIQGTGAVIVSGFMNALRVVGKPIKEHRILFFGAGSAAVGVARQLMDYVRSEDVSLSESDARRMFWLVDSKGLVTKDRGDKLAAHKVYFARDDNDGKQYKSIELVVDAVKPTCLIGLSSVAGAFTDKVLKKMANLNKHPIIFPLSNPATSAECTFEQAMIHTNHTVIFASGTAFPSFTRPDGKVITPGQGNNMYIFPGLGFGAILARSKQVTDKMIQAASAALADSLLQEERDAGDLYPHIERIRDVSAQVAACVIRAAVHEGQAQDPTTIAAFMDFSLIRNPVNRLHTEKEWVMHHMWSPTKDTCGLVVDVEGTHVKQVRLDQSHHKPKKVQVKAPVPVTPPNGQDWSIGSILLTVATISVVASAFAR